MQGVYATRNFNRLTIQEISDQVEEGSDRVNQGEGGMVGCNPIEVKMAEEAALNMPPPQPWVYYHHGSVEGLEDPW